MSRPKPNYFAEFKVGSIVYSYFKGLWRITEITKRKEYTPLVTLTKVATNAILPCKPEQRTCDMAWLRPVLESTLEYARVNGCAVQNQ